MPGNSGVIAIFCRSGNMDTAVPDSFIFKISNFWWLFWWKKLSHNNFYMIFIHILIRSNTDSAFCFFIGSYRCKIFWFHVICIRRSSVSTHMALCGGYHWCLQGKQGRSCGRSQMLCYHVRFSSQQSIPMDCCGRRYRHFLYIPVNKKKFHQGWSRTIPYFVASFSLTEFRAFFAWPSFTPTSASTQNPCGSM